MSQADIYKQYISDYENAAKKYNRHANAYQNSLVLQGGPIRAKDSNTGQEYGLYSTPDGTRQIVQSGSAQEYFNRSQSDGNVSGFIQNPSNSDYGTWVRAEGQDPKAIHSLGGQGLAEGYYTDLGNGVAAVRTGGKGTGQFVTERISGDSDMARQMSESGKYKDVKLVPGSSWSDDNGNTHDESYIDVTYEQMKFPDKPGAFNKDRPSLTLQQLREIQNPSQTVTDEERSGDVGLINSVRAKERLANGNGLLSTSR